MTQEDKELLLKDLCARLPYRVKVQMADGAIEELLNVNVSTFICNGLKGLPKPYLFPLSSITDEQERELSKLGVSYGEYALHDDIRGLGIMVDEAYIFFEFCYKHHIDFLGLIEKGLAIDATGLNVY